MILISEISLDVSPIRPSPRRSNNENQGVEIVKDSLLVKQLDTLFIAERDGISSDEEKEGEDDEEGSKKEEVRNNVDEYGINRSILRTRTSSRQYRDIVLYRVEEWRRRLRRKRIIRERRIIEVKMRS